MRCEWCIGMTMSQGKKKGRIEILPALLRGECFIETRLTVPAIGLLY